MPSVLGNDSGRGGGGEGKDTQQRFLGLDWSERGHLVNSLHSSQIQTRTGTWIEKGRMSSLVTGLDLGTGNQSISRWATALTHLPVT